MKLMEKAAKLTPEQREKFKAVKDAAALDAFLSENKLELTDEEKTNTLTYVETGKVPMSDEELENVAGGICNSFYDVVCPKCGWYAEYGHGFGMNACVNIDCAHYGKSIYLE